MQLPALFGAGVAALLINGTATAAPVPRDGQISGRIAARKQGETVVLVPTPQQRPAEVRQDLKAGDVLRTNAAGTLAIVFADRSQIRVGRNSTLVVKQVRQGVPSSVSLQRGSLWARSPRGASQLSVETPSATAAIRGTEYSIVASEEQTTLTVVEGVVDFFNPQGKLEVSQGQSAAARLGQAPTRIFTVNPDSREQMLYYVSLDTALSYLRPAAVPQARARGEAERVKRIDPASRSAEDWVSFAESGAEVEPRSAVEDALTRARGQALTPGQQARTKLVEANYAMKTRDYPRALRLFEEAFPVLQGRQKEVARYGVFINRTLVDPDSSGDELPSLNENEPVSYVGQAFLSAYLGDFAKARALAEAGLKRFPDESSLHAMLAGIGILTGDDKAMAEAARQALLVDPQDPFALRVQTELELNYRGNPRAAIATAERAASLSPGDDEMWNILAKSHHVWEQDRKAEQAFKTGLAEAPNSFILHGNYALFLFQQQRIAEAREQLALARALDQDNALVHLAEGFLDLSDGRREEALDHALDASAANPSYGEALLLLAEINYANGDYELAAQQMDAADRADPNNPFVALYRTAFALDSYKADEAIAAAREVLRRYRARGGVYASLSESKGTGSYIAGAFRLLNLSEWARYYGDRTYDPFVSTALFDRSLSLAANPYLFRHDYAPFDAEAGGSASALSDVLQGLRLDPLSIAGSEKELQLTRQKFVELSLTPSLVLSGDHVKLSQSATLSGVLLDPLPLAVSVSASLGRLELPLGTNNDRRSSSVSGFVGLKASPYDNLLFNAAYSKQRTDLTGTVQAPRDNGAVRDKTISAYGIYSHQFDRENVLSLGGGYLDNSRVLNRVDAVSLGGNPPVFLGSQYRDTLSFKGWLALANYAVGLGAVELQAGGEYYSTDVRTAKSGIFTLPPLLPETPSQALKFKLDQYHAYADLRFTPSDAFILEAQAALSGVKINAHANDNFDFAVGAAFAPSAGQWLRGAFVRSSNLQIPFTLAPTAVVGLKSADAPTGGGVPSNSFIGRWEAEWSPHLFTSVEAQHQEFDGLSFDKANVVDPIEVFNIDDFINLIELNLPIGASAVDVGPAKLDRVSASASVWLKGNIGLRAVYSYTNSEVEGGSAAGRPIPFVARHFARGQVTWTNDRRIKLTGGVSYVGPRSITLGGPRTDSAWLADAQFEWQLLDKRVQFNAGLFNLFDERVLLSPGVPNFGRTFAASLDVRF